MTEKNSEFKGDIFRKTCLHALFWVYWHCVKEFIFLLLIDHSMVCLCATNGESFIPPGESTCPQTEAFDTLTQKKISNTGLGEDSVGKVFLGKRMAFSVPRIMPS